jgi:ribosome-binding protein aMBF1 (putative translation factor)
LGITQRTIRASRSHIPSNRRAWKAFPTTLKTLGDCIKAKRFEKGLLQRELAEKLGVSKLRVKLWEHDQRVPNEAQRQALSDILSLSGELQFVNPKAE